MRITQVDITDLELLRSFAEHTFRVAYEKENDPVRFEQYCSKSFSKEQVFAEWSHPQSGFWFAWKGDKLAAYLKLNFDQHAEKLHSTRTVQVERIYVEASLQGQGIGERLLDFAHEKAQSLGAEWLWLSVWQARPAALRFYQRCGYEIFDTETFWLADEAQLDWLVKKPVLHSEHPR